MAVGVLYMIPSNFETLAQWSFANQAHHLDIARVIFEKQNVRVDQFLLDPFNPYDPSIWIYLHQQVHNQQNQALGIQGQDLTGVDFNDPDSLGDWVYVHANEHQQAATILGLG
jgi:hypothetical protein